MTDASPPIDPSVLLALAGRCEREESSRELDAAILNAVGHQAIARKIALSGWEWRKDGIGIWSRMPWPTTSIDAAVTLVPEGPRWGAGGNPICGAVGDVRATAKTPALALCAAALRARAAITQRN